MHLTSRVRSKFMFALSRARIDGGRSPQRAGHSRCGAGNGKEIFYRVGNKMMALNEEQHRQAILPWLNIDASDSDEVLLYIDRHFYLLRDDIMDTVRRLARQAEIDRDPIAKRIRPLWDVLQRARQFADRGTWDDSIAALAPRREWRL